MSNRRDFFKSIAGLFVVAAVDPASLLALKSPGPIHLPGLTNHEIAGQLYKLTKYMHEELVRGIGFFDGECTESKLGGPFNHQFCVDLSLSADDIRQLSDERIRERYVLPAMGLMADQINFRKATAFAKLPLTYSADFATRVTDHGVSLRGIRMFDPGCPTYGPCWVNRFDVLFAGQA